LEVEFTMEGLQALWGWGGGKETVISTGQTKIPLQWGGGYPKGGGGGGRDRFGMKGT